MIDVDDLRALSVKQPWCYTLARGLKPVENRNWRPASKMVGRRIALHASLAWDIERAYPVLPHTDGEWSNAAEFIQSLGVHLPVHEHDYPRGAIVAIATISRVVESKLELPASARPWFFGRFGWVLADPVTLAAPIEIAGALGLWQVPRPVALEIAEQLGAAA